MVSSSLMKTMFGVGIAEKKEASQNMNPKHAKQNKCQIRETPDPKRVRIQKSSFPLNAFADPLVCIP